jgi:hypothetical protein
VTVVSSDYFRLEVRLSTATPDIFEVHVLDKSFLPFHPKPIFVFVSEIDLLLITNHQVFPLHLTHQSLPSMEGG